MVLHVALLVGGLSRERDVSLDSGKSVESALNKLGHQVTVIDVGHDIVQKLCEAKPDVAFNSLHGTYGEDGCIQGVLEYLNIPYTHSNVSASAIAMNKPLAGKVFDSLGIRRPAQKVMSYNELYSIYAMGEEVMERPYVLKPSAEGSSIGVHIVEKDSEFSFTDSVWNSGSPLVIEEFIPGRELTSVVFDEKALGVIELQPEKGFYDYESKYTHGKTIHITPAEIPPEIYAAVNEIALKAHEALGCRTLSRADFRYDDTNGHSVDNIYLLEINTHPGFTELSLVPELAAYNGIPFIAIVDKLVQDATCMSKKADNNAVPVYSYEKAEV